MNGARKATMVLVAASLVIAFGLLLDGPHTGHTAGVWPLGVGIALSVVALATVQIRRRKLADDRPKDFLLMAQAELAQYTRALCRSSDPNWGDRLESEFEALAKLHGVPKEACFKQASWHAWLHGDAETSRKIRTTYIDLALAYELAGGAGNSRVAVSTFKTDAGPGGMDEPAKRPDGMNEPSIRQVGAENAALEKFSVVAALIIAVGGWAMVLVSLGIHV